MDDELHPEISEGIAEMADPDGGNMPALAENARDLMAVLTIMNRIRVGRAANFTRRRIAHVAIRQETRGANDNSIGRSIDQ